MMCIPLVLVNRAARAAYTAARRHPANFDVFLIRFVLQSVTQVTPKCDVLAATRPARACLRGGEE